MSLKWLHNQGNLSTAWYGFAPTGQRGKWYEKIFFAFDFHSLLWQRHIGARIIPCHCISITRPTLERRKTLGHPRSINRNMIIHFANQSQTCQIFKVVNNIFSKLFMKRNCEKWWNQSQVELIYKIHIDYQERHIYIYIYIYIYIHTYISSSWHNILTISPRCVNRNLAGGQ